MDEVIQRARNGDQVALNRLYDMSATRVFRLAQALVGDAFAAEEVMQDSLQYALSNLHRFDSQRAAWTTWLHTITVSRSRDWARRKRWNFVPLIGQFISGAPSPQTLSEQREQTGELHAALLQLSPKLREAVALRFVDDLDYSQIGEILQCPAKTAQSRVRLGLAKLRELLHEHPEIDANRI